MSVYKGWKYVKHEEERFIRISEHQEVGWKKKTRCSQTHFEGFGKMKHCFECLI